MLWHAIFVTLDGSSHTREMRDDEASPDIIVPLPTPLPAYFSANYPIYNVHLKTRRFVRRERIAASMSHGVLIYREEP